MVKQCTKCAYWEEGVNILDSLIAFANIHGSGDYSGKLFVFCPWCGAKLKEK